MNLVCCRAMRFDGARVITHDSIVDRRGCNAVSGGRGDEGYGADGSGPFLRGVPGRFVDPCPLPFSFAFGFSFLALAFAFGTLRAFGLVVGVAASGGAFFGHVGELGHEVGGEIVVGSSEHGCAFVVGLNVVLELVEFGDGL